MNLTDIKNLFDYTEWANDLAMDAASKLPDEGLLRDVWPRAARNRSSFLPSSRDIA